MGAKMITVNSLSGGKSSSYMAVHYPADYNVFALVRTEDKKSALPEYLKREVEAKLNMEVIATAEDDRTIIAMLDLEHTLGKEIVWVTGETFDELIRRKKALPNKHWRFCTTELKIKPIFEWWQKEFTEIVEMRCGYRYDEDYRKDNFSTTFKTIVGKSKTGTQNRWADIEWRVGAFPMIDDKINVWDVSKYWKHTSMKFPPDSNCVGCFWKDVQQLRKNWEENPEKMHWFANQETKKRTWKTDTTYDNIAKIGIQQDFVFGTGSGCMAGECSN